MKNAPCAKLTIRMIPKISVSPTPRKNSSAACDNAFRHCTSRNANVSMWRSVGVFHLLAGRRHLVGLVGGDHLGNRMFHAGFFDHLDDEALLFRLMVAGAHDD